MLLRRDDPGAAFTAVTRPGTESAVLIHFRKDIAAIVQAWVRSLFKPALRRDPNAPPLPAPALPCPARSGPGRARASGS
ncbi:hypothetical protein KNE206_78620 [Kitasatospora sp. NE20-6]